jgi:hypothetical protein
MDALTIVPSDHNVTIDGETLLGEPEAGRTAMDLSTCGIPSDVHALHWWREESGNKGRIEYTDSRQHKEITVIPEWAQACVEVFNQVKYAEENPPAPTEEEVRQGHILAVEGERRHKLAASDWTQLPGGPLTDAQKEEWATYRQALRDITSQPDFPVNVTWPTEPADFDKPAGTPLYP